MTYAPPRGDMPGRTVRELENEQFEVNRAPIWVATVTAGATAVEYADALAEMRAADLANGWGLWAGRIVNRSGANISFARNEVVASFLRQPPEKAEWLLWLDSDMVPPPDFMYRLLAASAITGGKVIGGLCVMDKDEGPVPTLYQLAPPGADGVTIVQFDYEPGTIAQVAATGSACVMIHRSVFEAMADAMPGVRYPWYTEREVGGHWVSEDIHFCLKAGELGFTQYVDCTTQVGHQKGKRTLWPADIKTGVGVPPAKRVVVIPVKDRLDLTSDLVHQLREQGEAADIVICDNGSGTRTRNWLDSQDDLVVLDMADAGINEMWNAGCAWALEKHGPRIHVAILNNDLRLGHGFLGELSRALDSDRDLVAVSANYDGRSGRGLVEETTDICAGRYDGTGGFAGFAFMLKGAFVSAGYRFPEQCRYWFGDNDLLTSIAWTPLGKAGIALRAEVEHLDGGSQTAGDVAWSAYQEQTERDREAYEARWAAHARNDIAHRLARNDLTAAEAADALRQVGVEPHTPTPGARVAVLTAMFGDHDIVRPLPAQDIECDAILLTDRPYDVPGWRNVVVPIPDEMTPRVAAKRPRCRPDGFVDADVVVWVDAHVEVRCASLVGELVDQLGDGAVGAFRHSFHTSISQEAALASTLPKYAGYDLTGQAKHYLAEGHPDTWGMWTTGVMVRRPAATVEFGDAWWAEVERWGPEDQISLPYALRRTVGYPVDLPFEGWWVGERFTLHQHNDGTM